MLDEAAARQTADRKARGETWTNRIIIAAASWLWTNRISILALIIATASWLCPREPTPAKIDPNFIYQNGSPIGRVKSYTVAPGAPNFNVDVDRSSKINSNDVIEFTGKRCFIINLNETNFDLDKQMYSYHIYCRVV